MFLDVLNNEEKEWFLDLAIKAAESNGEVVKEEKRMLQSFAKEMGIPPRVTTSRSLQDTLKSFINYSSKASLRIVLFELIGILFSDSEFDAKEREYINSVALSFGFDSSMVDKMISDINEYAVIFNKICKTVFPG